MELSRLYDVNVHRRRLKGLLLQVNERFGLPEPVPHAFDTERLLDAAHRTLDRPDIDADAALFSDLSEAVGIVEALTADPTSAEATFAAARDRSADGAARFGYLIGLYLHLHRGDVAEAARSFDQALESANGDRALRSLIHLAVARAAREAGDHSYSAWAFNEVLQRASRSVTPYALQGLASLALVREQLDQAEQLGVRALREFDAVDDRLGVLTARSHLSNVALARGDADAARRELETVVAARRETCDIMRLPKSLNNLAVVHERLGDFTAARATLLEAMRLNRDQSRERLLAGNYHNLGSCLETAGEPVAAMAAYDEAMRLARGVGAHDRELSSIHAAMRLVSDRADSNGGANGKSPAIVGGLVVRGNELLRGHAESLGREAILGFSLQSSDAYIAGRASGAAMDIVNAEWVPRQGQQRLAALTAFGSGPGILDRLESEVSEALGMRGAPEGSLVSEFLGLFLGDYLKNNDYAGEFGVSHHTAKRHLKALCGAGVLALTGTRKAARYSVALLNS